MEIYKNLDSPQNKTFKIVNLERKKRVGEGSIIEAEITKITDKFVGCT